MSKPISHVRAVSGCRSPQVTSRAVRSWIAPGGGPLIEPAGKDDAMSASHRRLTHFSRGAGVNGTAGVSGGGFSGTAAAGGFAPPVISVRGLTKHYGDTHAVRGIDLEVRDGEIFAFLGPNGAGKTTTAEILEGFRRPTGGRVSVLGADPAEAGGAWRSEEHTSELQSPVHLVCRLLLEKKKINGFNLTLDEINKNIRKFT